jgi:uncharacterized integral membrane protein (TIGR00698 family)
MINRESLFKIAPGLLLCSAFAALIVGATSLLPKTGFDPLLIALVLGIAFKNIFPKAQWHSAGTKFSGKFILELSVMILGASIFFPAVGSAGVGLFALIMFGVAGSMAIAFFVGHTLLKLGPRLSILIGVSNSICGNSAAAIIAPIIGASSVELASVIAISGLLGAAQIILLPLLVPVFGLGDYHYGVVAGMAVYAVAHVYAASATVSPLSASIATFVKLMRVVLLAPLVVVVQLLISLRSSESGTKGDRKVFGWTSIFQYVPWFVIGFIVLAALRSSGIIGEGLGSDIRELSRYSFLVAMVAIGMGVDVRDILKVGPKVVVVIAAVVLFMITISLIGGSYLQPTQY